MELGDEQDVGIVAIEFLQLVDVVTKHSIYTPLPIVCGYRKSPEGKTEQSVVR